MLKLWLHYKTNGSHQIFVICIFFLAFHWINDNNKNIKGPTFFNKACGLKTLHFSCIRIIVLYV